MAYIGALWRMQCQHSIGLLYLIGLTFTIPGIDNPSHDFKAHRNRYRGLVIVKPLLLASILVLSGVGAIVAQAAEDYCRAFKELEEDVNGSTPIRGGAMDLLQLKVNCQNKTVVYKRRLNSLVTTVSAAWREQQQREHKQRHCDKNGIAYRYEWYVRDEIYNKEGKWLATLTTKPRDCAKEEPKQ